jgi:ABC-2 type transport system permease protein
MGYTMTFSLIALFQSVELVAVASLLFNVAFVGSIFFALALIVVYAISILGLGILLSTLAKNEFQAIQFVPLIFTPSILLAGILWPIESMPGFIRPVSSLIPLTYLADALRSVMIRGWGPVEVWVEMTVLIAFALLTIGASIVLMKIKSNRMGLKK